jgi:hypothetical protein
MVVLRLILLLLSLLDSDDLPCPLPGYQLYSVDAASRGRMFHGAIRLRIPSLMISV